MVAVSSDLQKSLTRLSAGPSEQVEDSSSAPQVQADHSSQLIDVRRPIRIATVLFAAAALGLLVPNSPDTLFRGADVSDVAPGWLPLWFDDIGAGRWSVWVAALAVVASVSGWLPGPALIVQWWFAVSVFSSVLVVEGGEQVACVTLFLLLPVAFVDRRRRASAPLVVGLASTALRDRAILLALFLVKAQVTVIYFDSVLAKLGRPNWQEGTAVYYFGQDPVFGPPSWIEPALSRFYQWDWGSPALTWGTLAVEAFLGVAPWLARDSARRTALWTAVAFHGTIAIMLGLPTFALAMTAANVLALGIGAIPLSRGRSPEGVVS